MIAKVCLSGFFCLALLSLYDNANTSLLLVCSLFYAATKDQVDVIFCIGIQKSQNKINESAFLV